MLSATLNDGLRSYGIGAKLRALRLKKKMGLVELGTHSGLSPAMLSKIERGRLYPTLPTLLRIALVFSVDLAFFFAGAREKPLVAVMKKAQRVTLPERPGLAPAYRFASLDYAATERRFNSFLADFLAPTKENVRPHAHPGVEFLFVLTGALVVAIAGEDYAVAAGDSIYFDSSVPHSYRRQGSRACRALVVTSGP